MSAVYDQKGHRQMMGHHSAASPADQWALLALRQPLLLGWQFLMAAVKQQRVTQSHV